MAAPRVLVAYGSKYGSTAEIARIIGGRIAAAGFEVDVWPASDVHKVDPYAAAVVGSAICAGRWRKDMVRLLRRSRKDLAARPTWLFHSGPLDAEPDHAAQPLPPKVAALARAIGVRGSVTFGGAGDLRDIDEIRRWADRIAGELERSQSAA